MADSLYSSILARVPQGIPHNHSLFQPLLLALLSGERNVILNSADDLGALAKLTSNVLYNLFSLSVLKLKLRPSDKLTAASFLRLLFLNHPGRRRPLLPRPSKSRTPSFLARNSYIFKRSSSYSNDIVENAHDDNDTIPTTPSSLAPADPLWENKKLHPVPRQLTGGGSDAEPESPMGPVRDSNKTFPQVLVVSGLEYTSDVVQRTLMRVLDKRQVTLEGKEEYERGTWNLPQGFFVIYLNPITDGRPQLHKSLLDRFAFSFNVSLPAGSADILWKEIDTRFILAPNEIANFRASVSASSIFIHEKLHLYISDLFTATRHHQHIDGTLLSAQALADCLHVTRVWRLLFASPPTPNSLPSSEGRGPGVHSVTGLDVSDEDVRSVFPRVVTHRLKPRAGPRDELLASAVFGATDGLGEIQYGPNEKRAVTVGEVLAEIMNTV